jgi:putative transcriptional regulator
MESPDGLSGRLLVAQPHLLDPNFHRTVVLLLQHSDEGALGVVLNRPSDVDLAEAVPGWADHGANPARVFGGGPVVDEGSAICLARARQGIDGEVFKPLHGELGTIDIGRDPAEVGAHVDEIRLFAGYAGWTAGQLETEIEVGGWWVLDARHADVFTADPEHLWQAVLGRQPGHLAWFAFYPPDPDLN